MTYHSIARGSLTVERIYDAPAADVFFAWSDPDFKAKWFIGPDGWRQTARELQFEVGGVERLGGVHRDGMETMYTARFHAIVPNKQLVYVYDMHVNHAHHSVSLSTVELSAVSGGTRLVYTEDVAFLDGTDGVKGTASRKRGNETHLDRLTLHLRRAS